MQHVVGAADDAAVQPQPIRHARNRGRIHHGADQIARAVAQKWAIHPTQIGDDEFAQLAGRDRVGAAGREDFGDVVVAQDRDLPRRGQKFDGHGADLGEAVVVEDARAPDGLDAVAGRGDRPARLAGDDERPHRRGLQIDAVAGGQFGEVQRVSRRGENDSDCVVEDHPQPRGRANAAAGDGEHAQACRRLERAPEAQEWAETEREKRPVGAGQPP